MSELDLFIEALGHSDPVARSAFLDEKCAGDPELRDRLERLLTGHARADNPLDRISSGAEDFAINENPWSSFATGAYPFERELRTQGDPNRSGFATSPTAMPEGIGSVIADRYTLIGLIGEGGMGSVYLAEQTRPVKRQVALKLIKTGADSRAVLARFDAERQALALMDHPNIARIYDGGVTPTARPFFVMELVRGVPLTDFCDMRRLPVKARLELFVSVCHAVQHAHQKGIIHRDLKPGNVLVTEVDGRPTPKVIDFGVAKATEMNLTDLSFADVGAIVGTPAYMSPEQADPSSMDIDTRTDVYALGVILYELLTGLPPIDAKQFQRGAVLEMLRMVREVDPPRPSTKLSTSISLPSIAANRSVEPSKLARLLHGELDWVVMKALEKDRSRRYDSANGLAADVLRHLAHEPVLAAPPGRIYRLKKFARKYRGPLSAAALVLLALIGGIAGTTWGFFQAKKNAAAAVAARAEAESRRLEAEAESRRADALATVAAAQRELALDALGGLVGKVQTQLDTAPGTQQLRRELLDEALAGLRKVSAGGGSNVADLRMVEGHRRLGELGMRLGDLELARSNFEKVNEIVLIQASADPGDPERRRAVSAAAIKLGDLAKHVGDRAEAARHYETARRIRAEFAANGGLPALVDFAQVLVRLGDVSEPKDSLGMYKAALGVREEVLKAKPGDLTTIRDLRIAHSKLASWHLAAGDSNAARPFAEKAVELSEGLVKSFPMFPQLKMDQGICLIDLARVDRAGGRADDALKRSQDALRVFEPLAVGNPRDNLLQIQHGLALARAKRPGDAAKVAARVRDQAPKDGPLLYDSSCIYALASTSAENPTEASRLTDEAITTLKAALAAGFVDHNLIRTDPDLSAIRDLPGFQDILQGLK